jgi:hypothetical protein
VQIAHDARRSGGTVTTPGRGKIPDPKLQAPKKPQFQAPNKVLINGIYFKSSILWNLSIGACLSFEFWRLEFMSEAN